MSHQPEHPQTPAELLAAIQASTADNVSRFTPLQIPVYDERSQFWTGAHEQLYVAATNGEIPPEDLHKAIGDRFGMLEVQRTTDGLTGLKNRAAIFEYGSAMLEYNQATGQPVTVAMTDLDGFKKVNDTYGHNVGDVVLRNFADIASQNLGQGRTIGRYGGEEFTIVLPNTGAQEARQILEGIRADVELNLATRVGETIQTGMKNMVDGVPTPLYPPTTTWPEQVTVSIGFDEAKPGDNLALLINRADVGLYAAKGKLTDPTGQVRTPKNIVVQYHSAFLNPPNDDTDTVK